jgi:hypothetical protein
MFLGPEDLDRLRALGYDIDAVAMPSPDYPGQRIIRNEKGRCVFLEGDGPYKCVLYPDHPTGCRFYPLIYDADRQACILDKKYCKYWRNFQPVLVDLAACTELVAYLHEVLKVI